MTYNSKIQIQCFFINPKPLDSEHETGTRKSKVFHSELTHSARDATKRKASLKITTF